MSSQDQGNEYNANEVNDYDQNLLEEDLQNLEEIERVI